MQGNFQVTKQNGLIATPYWEEEEIARVDARGRAEVPDRRSGRDDDRVTAGRKPDAAEQSDERGWFGKEARGHSLGDTPSVVGVVGVDRARDVVDL